MARQPTTALVRSARRFSTRRVEHALVRRDAAMLDDPLRAGRLALAAGGLVAAAAVAAAAVLAVLSPRGDVGAPVLLVRETGALYVRVGDTVHPVPNLASARLIAGRPVDPVQVSAAAVTALERGPALGIAGAPAAIGPAPSAPSWLVCDDARRTVVLAGGDTHGLDGRRAALVTPIGEAPSVTYLLYGGRRAAVDLRNLAVLRALRLTGVAPHPVSRLLLDMVPEVPPIATPPIAGAGGPGALAGHPVGSVIEVERSGGTERFVVLRDGLQAVGEVAADVIRFGYATGGARIETVEPAAAATTPVRDDLPVSTFPDRAGIPVGAVGGVCARWDPAGGTTVYTGHATAGPGAVELGSADGPGPRVDAVAMTPGTTADLRPVAVRPGTGADSAADVASGTGGPRFVIVEGGTVFGVRDDAAARALGLGDPPAPAPWPLIAHLPRGPELAIDRASVAQSVPGI